MRHRFFSALMDDFSIDAVLITGRTNVRYFTGFTGSNAQAVAFRDERWFLTDSRYKTQARDEVRGYRIKIYKNGLPETSALIKKRKVKRLGIEGRAIDYSTYLKLKKLLPGTRFIDVEEGIASRRAIKDSSEIEAIKKAVSFADAGFRVIETKPVIGRTEKELALDIEREVKKRGADGLSFDIIVASGKRSALPHGAPSDKRIRAGEFLTIDMGASFKGYKSDETRTYVIGRPTRRQKEIYGIVKAAHDSAMEAVRDGVSAKDIDRAARDVIKKAGYGKYFGHGTGHGVGMDVHEAPGISGLSKDVLASGMVITIEPGIYIPEFGGVRIESMVLVKKNGCEVLTNDKKELRVL
ncbi:MAG TPA: Xaa-Pro peptidase family protein [Thermodesulfobacteriota bacterium]|nr:Xaa-Pro peptidase family protein [Thermodesulfobacteriota bacterium]